MEEYVAKLIKTRTIHPLLWHLIEHKKTNKHPSKLVFSSTSNIANLVNSKKRRRASRRYRVILFKGIKKPMMALTNIGFISLEHRNSIEASSITR
ncbi:MAG: hypothetical protein CMI14_11910 [Oleispira sp.]|nr:hypothetical protein [Oleispira sp.]|tara:strand:+ start:610 stop:894 length:285 start_codon:yes stop_codon:yes gene_type:complete